MSLTAQLFSPADYIALAAATGVHKEILASRLAYTRSLNEFRVPEIKEIIRWLKTRTNWQANPELHRRTQTSATGTAGKKQQLIDHLKNILQAQQQVVQLQAQGQYDPNNPAFAAAAAAVAASSNLPPNSAEMQAQYRAQQQHAQQAAARFQASAESVTRGA
jgi:hypothetical protein